MEYITTDGSSKFSGTDIYFYKPMILTAYSPFAGAEGTAPGIGGGWVLETHTLAENQTSGTQPKIDFMFAKTEQIKLAEPTINLTFAHKMSKLTFTFLDSYKTQNGETVKNVDVGNIVRYEIEGLGIKGTFNTLTGECAINDSIADKDVRQNLIVKFDKNNAETKVKHNQAVPPLIVFPQAPGNNVVLLHLYLDEVDQEEHEQHYITKLNFGNGELKPEKTINTQFELPKQVFKSEQ